MTKKERAAEIAAMTLVIIVSPFVVLFVGAHEVYRTIRRWLDGDRERAERVGNFALGVALILLSPLIARSIVFTYSHCLELALANSEQLSRLLEGSFRIGLLGAIAVLGFGFISNRRFRWEVMGFLGAAMLLYGGASYLGLDLSWIRSTWTWLRDPHLVQLAKAAIEWIRAAA